MMMMMLMMIYLQVNRVPAWLAGVMADRVYLCRVAGGPIWQVTPRIL